MSELSTFMSSLEARIKEYEAAIATSLAKHNGLLGALQELKNVMTIAAPIVEAVVPGSSAIVNTIEGVVDAVDNAVMPAGNAAAPSAEVPSAE